MGIEDSIKDYAGYDRLQNAAEDYTNTHNITNSLKTGIQSKNAFFHAFVSANIAYEKNRYISTSLGNIREMNGIVKDLADLFSGNLSLKNMDAHMRDSMRDSFNNEMGVQIAEYTAKVGLPQSAIGDLTKDALENGRLITNEFTDPRVSWYGITPTGIPELTYIGPSATFAKEIANKYGIDVNNVNKCFAGGTLILMSDFSLCAIESLEPGDMIASFNQAVGDGRGALVGRRVIRTFVNENQIVIDFHGTRVTPGHAYLCGDGPHEGRFRQIMNIVRDDGAVVLADGSLMRAATGCAAGSAGDSFVEVQIARPARHKETGESVTLLKERGRVRAGTRVRKLDGSFVSFLDLIEANGWTLHADGLVGQGPGHAPEPLLWAGPSIPKPEDYILALSQLTLADLYSDPQQAERPGVPLSHRSDQGEANAVVLQAAPSSRDAEPVANDGYGRTLVHRARRLLDGKRAKPNRVPKQAGETVH